LVIDSKLGAISEAHCAAGPDAKIEAYSSGDKVMANVYVEPQPSGRPEGSAITHYTLEYAHRARVTPTDYQTQAAAVAEAKRLGHQPLIARVRNTNKGNPDHWRAA
jgi:hypothetical protein